MREELFRTKYFKVMENKPDGVKDPYFYITGNKDNQVVSLLPYRHVNGEMEFLLRKEIVPSWDDNEMFYVSVGGSVEKGDVVASALMELSEETGYGVGMSDLIPLGIIHGEKCTDFTFYLFSVDLTNKTQGEILGDGSELEKLASCEWVTNKQIDLAVDPIVYAMLHKLLKT